VRVELPLGTIACPELPASIGGKINLDGSKGDVWVKVIPLRGDGGGEARVSRSGYFMVSGLELSTYVVVVIQGEVVLHHQVVKTYPVGTDTSKLSINIRQPR
jgi:hypothetical protein